MTTSDEFLQYRFNATQYVTIGAQEPGMDGIDARTFRTLLLPDARDYASSLVQAGKQVFYGVLPRKGALPDGYPGAREDIAPGDVAWVDIDFKHNTLPPKQIHDLVFRASAIVFSGHGFHAYWRLSRATTPDDIESINRGIHAALASAKPYGVKADSTHNSNRLLRLPGSVNHKLNCEPVRTLVRVRDARFKLEDMPRLASTASATPRSDAPKALAKRQRRAFLLSLLDRLPAFVQRMLTSGERYGVQNRNTSDYLQACVTELVNYGWTDTQVYDLFVSDVSLHAVRVFQARYDGRVDVEIARCLSKAHTNETNHGHILPRLLDDEYLLNGRELLAPASSQHEQLHTLGGLALALYDGAIQPPRAYLAPLAIGTGKTTRFMLPLVVSIGKRFVEGETRGVIVAVERRRDAKRFAARVNEEVGSEVAFTLFSHDPDTCAPDCKVRHDEWHEEATRHPILFMTHAMLALRGVAPYKTWMGGTRVLCIIDEKPAAWWNKGAITHDDLRLLEEACSVFAPHSVIRAVRDMLAGSHASSMPNARLTPPQAARLRELLATASAGAFAGYRVAQPQGVAERERVERAITNLLLLSQHGGHVVRAPVPCVLIARRALLPSVDGVPTIILDATGVLDPEYPQDVEVMDVPRARHTASRFASRLFHFSQTYSKSNLSEEKLEQVVNVAQNLLASRAPDGVVYVVSAKEHEDALRDALRASGADESRLILDHYGNTKGSNAMRGACAIVFASIQDKGDAYYRALARAIGRADAASEVKTRGGKTRRFVDVEIEALKRRDQLVTIVQEIGRTRIREGAPVDIFLPWANTQEVIVLSKLLQDQFGLPLAVSSLPGTKERFIELLSLPGTYSKKELAERLGVGLTRISHLLATEGVKKHLWGVSATVSKSDIAIPALRFPTSSIVSRDATLDESASAGAFASRSSAL